jgi:hypothetical protein
LDDGAEWRIYLVVTVVVERHGLRFVWTVAWGWIVDSPILVAKYIFPPMIYFPPFSIPSRHFEYLTISHHHHRTPIHHPQLLRHLSTFVG